MPPESPTCPHARGCEMYALFQSKTLLEAWKLRFCMADYTKCKRHELSLCGERVPVTLLPNGMNLPDLAGGKK